MTAPEKPPTEWSEDFLATLGAWPEDIPRPPQASEPRDPFEGLTPEDEAGLDDADLSFACDVDL